MEVAQTVARSKHCCCLVAGEYSLFGVSKFRALVEDIIIIIISDLFFPVLIWFVCYPLVLVLYF
jgi:hypothetical protein